MYARKVFSSSSQSARCSAHLSTSIRISWSRTIDERKNLEWDRQIIFLCYMRLTEGDGEFKKWKKKQENRMLDKMTGDPIVREIDLYSREVCNNSSTQMGDREGPRRRTKFILRSPNSELGPSNFLFLSYYQKCLLPTDNS